MTQVTGPGRWYTVGQYLVDSTYNGLSSKPARRGQTPGEIAWDNCTCEGVLAVSVPRVFLAEDFPSEADAPVGVRCNVPYEVAEFTVSVIRCAPQPEGADMAPPADDLDSAAGLLLQDMAETMDSLALTLCGLKEDDTIDDFLITPAEAAGPEGACVGFNLRVQISLVRL
jgi:hypothetical protein